MIKKFTLSNGVRVLTERMESIRSVAVGAFIGAGSRHEPHQWNGVSHFIEHMLFKGTKRRTAKQIAEEIDSIGGHIDAFTSKDCTCFYTRTLDNHLPISVDVISDILMNAKLLKKDTDLERNVIFEEINMYEDSPEDMAHEELAKTVWSTSPLGMPILGGFDTLPAINGMVMREYMRQQYYPGNIVLSVVGSFDEDALPALLEKKFKRLGGARTPEPRAEADTPVFNADKCFKVKDTEQIHLCVGYEGIELGNDDSYALNLANYIIGGGMSSILFQKIREEQGLVYAVFSYLTAFENAGLFTVYAGTKPENAPKVQELILREITALKKGGMTKELLSRAKEQFKGSFMMGLESPGGRMMALGKSELLLNKVRSPEEIMGIVDNITLENVYSVMEKVFDDNKRALSAVGAITDKLEARLSGE